MTPQLLEVLTCVSRSLLPCTLMAATCHGSADPSKPRIRLGRARGGALFKLGGASVVGEGIGGSPKRVGLRYLPVGLCRLQFGGDSRAGREEKIANRKSPGKHWGEEFHKWKEYGRVVAEAMHTSNFRVVDLS